MDSKIKHLEFIQGVINRMAANSFLLKRWAVVLVSALLVLIARDNQVEYAIIGLIPVVVFWGLDGYFLWQERLFRELYDKVRKGDDSVTEFSMKTNGSESTWVKAVFSVTLVPFYMVLTIIILLAVGISLAISTGSG